MTVEDIQLIIVRTASFVADLFTERRRLPQPRRAGRDRQGIGRDHFARSHGWCSVIATVSLSISIFNLLPIPCSMAVTSCLLHR